MKRSRAEKRQRKQQNKVQKNTHGRKQANHFDTFAARMKQHMLVKTSVTARRLLVGFATCFLHTSLA